MSEFFRLILENEVSRGILFGFIGAILSIPAAAVGLLLKKIPKSVLARERIPLIMAGVGLLLGGLLGSLPWFDMSHSVQVGIQAGAMSGVAKDNVLPGY